MNGHIKHKIVKEKHDKNKKYETHKYAHKTGTFIPTLINHYLGGIHMNMMPDTKLGAIAKNVIKQMA